MKTEKQIKAKIKRMKLSLNILRKAISENKFSDKTPGDRALIQAERELRFEIQMLRWTLK